MGTGCWWGPGPRAVRDTPAARGGPVRSASLRQLGPVHALAAGLAPGPREHSLTATEVF